MEASGLDDARSNRSIDRSLSAGPHEETEKARDKMGGLTYVTGL